MSKFKKVGEWTKDEFDSAVVDAGLQTIMNAINKLSSDVAAVKRQVDDIQNRVKNIEAKR